MREYNVRAEVYYLAENKEDASAPPEEVVVHKEDRVVGKNESVYDVLFEIAAESDMATALEEEFDETD